MVELKQLANQVFWKSFHSPCKKRGAECSCIITEVVECPLLKFGPVSIATGNSAFLKGIKKQGVWSSTGLKVRLCCRDYAHHSRIWLSLHGTADSRINFLYAAMTLLFKD